MSIMQVSSGFAHMLMSNQRGRGHEPVTVLGSIRSFVTVNATDRPSRPRIHTDRAEHGKYSRSRDLSRAMTRSVFIRVIVFVRV